MIIETIPEFPELFLKEAELLLDREELGKLQVRERSFILEGGLKIHGSLVKESDDSFIVALSAVITQTPEGHVLCKLLTDRRLIRYFKSSILHVCIPDEFERYCYFKCILESKDLIPDFFSPQRLGYVESQLAKYEVENDHISEVVKMNYQGVPEEDPKLVADKDNMLPPNASPDSFRYLYVHRTRQ